MKVSLKFLLLVVASIAVIMAILVHKTPIDLLRVKGAAYGKPNTGHLYLLAFPKHWSSYGYVEEGATTNEEVEIVSFPQNAGLTESDFKNLKNFPNLKAVSADDKIPLNWLYHLDECPNLAVLCLTKTPTDDEIVGYLKSVSSLRFVSVSGDRIVVDPEWRK